MLYLRLLRVRILLLFAGILLIISCEKEVHISPGSGGSQLVVNGYIERGYPPILALTNSLSYFSTIDIASLANSFAHGAHVTVSDGTDTVTLREYTIDSLGYKLSFYSIDSSNPASFFFVGQTDHYYTLHIDYSGKSYESITKIPNCRPIDSLKGQVLNPPLKNAPTAVQLLAYYTDPDTFGNCIRYFTKRNSDPYYPGYNSVYDDELVNGAKNAALPLAAGSAPVKQTIPSDSTGYVFKGDTVTVKWCAIDRQVYNFYNTLEYSLGTVGNPFSSPINVTSNVSNGALGIWAGYGSTYITIVIPK